jgi:hypothetical protein
LHVVAYTRQTRTLALRGTVDTLLDAAMAPVGLSGDNVSDLHFQRLLDQN